MSYRTLLVPLDSDPSCSVRTAYAIGLAQALKANLVGLVPTGLADLPLSLGAAAALSQYVTEADAALRREAEHVATQFRAACERAGHRAFETVIAEDEAGVALLRHAHACDLAVLSQPEPGTPHQGRQRALVDQSVLNSPRPTLLVPYAGRFEPPARRVLVAWDEGREAARAMADALPLLTRAEQVRVLRWARASDDTQALGQRLEGLSRWLLGHGVHVAASVEVSDVGVADAMLSRASDMDADLIVMGAYGHARWTQRMVGGATRGILDTMTVPVLMSR